MGDGIKEEIGKKPTKATKVKIGEDMKKYSKNQFIQSDIYSEIEKDILEIILQDNGRYSKDEVKKRLESFRKKEVR